jgi:PKD repeat protein
VQYVVDVALTDDEIRVATGVYTDVHMRPRNDITTTGVVTQVVYISKTVTIRGGYTTTNWTTSDPVANPTTLDAQEQGRVIYITGNISPTIEGLGIVRGNVLGYSPDGQFSGGGIYVISATVLINNNRIFSNTAGYGGGLAIDSGGAQLEGNIIAGNSASWGGGLQVTSGSATLNKNTFTNNSGYWGGGALFVNGKIALNRNIISGNIGGSSGMSLYLKSDRPGMGMIPQGGPGVPAGGGGLLLLDSTATLTNNIITNNVLGENPSVGAGLLIIGSSSHLLHNTIAHNSISNSGMYVTNSRASHSDVILTNTIFVTHTIGISVTEGNTATINGILWYNTPITISQEATATVNIYHQYIGNPAFASDGYHLTDASEAIDRGVDAGVTTDIDDQHRPVGKSPDLGADEYPTATIFLPLVLRDYATPLPPKANYSASPTSGVVPLTVFFTNISTGDYTSSLWDFGDGITSTTTSPTHIYALTGTYTVTLTVSRASETNTLQRANYITVYATSPCDDKIANGGFESGGAWEIDSGYPAAYTTTIFHNGNRSMRAGILDPAANVKGLSAFRQTVTIPRHPQSATLRFWLYPTITGSTSDSDEQRVLLLDQLGNTVQTLVKLRSNTRAWTPYEFDLTKYAGNTLRLYFGVYNNGSGSVTAMYVDDVSLQVCPAP